MTRTQILLTDEQAAALRELAAREGRSMADLVRDGVDALLRQRRGVGRDEMKQRSLRAVGRYDSGRTDVSSRHDDYLDEAFGR
jgi:hypothetical protein